MVASYQRMRQKGNPLEDVVVKIRRLSPPGYEFEYSELRHWSSYWEQMSDNLGPKSVYHAVKHDKMSFRIEKLRAWEIDAGSPVGFSEYTASPYWVPRSPYLFTFSNAISWLDSSGYERGSERWQDFTARAFESITEQIPEAIDLPNMLRDLFTLKGLVKQCGNLGLRVIKIFSDMRAYRGAFSHLLTLRQLMKNVSDGFLINEFGIKPLISEFTGLLSKVASVLRKLLFLRRTQGSVFTARYAESIPLSGETRDLGLADDVGMADSKIWLRDCSGSVSYNCSARVKNELIGLDGFFADVKTALAALGSRTISSFLWDLVPFSFVVDWVFNVSGLLDRYASVKPFSGDLKIVSAGTSFKKVVSGKLTVEGPSLVMGKLTIGDVFITHYDRQPGLDTGVNVFGPLSELSSKQLAILSALVTQRVKG